MHIGCLASFMTDTSSQCRLRRACHGVRLVQNDKLESRAVEKTHVHVNTATVGQIRPNIGFRYSTCHDNRRNRYERMRWQYKKRYAKKRYERMKRFEGLRKHWDSMRPEATTRFISATPHQHAWKSSWCSRSSLSARAQRQSHGRLTHSAEGMANERQCF
jgi:hypothetical protein